MQITQTPRDIDDLHFWSLQERGFYAEPDEADLPTFYEVANDPLLIAPVPRMPA